MTNPLHIMKNNFLPEQKNFVNGLFYVFAKLFNVWLHRKQVLVSASVYFLL